MSSSTRASKAFPARNSGVGGLFGAVGTSWFTPRFTPTITMRCAPSEIAGSSGVF